MTETEMELITKTLLSEQKKLRFWNYFILPNFTLLHFQKIIEPVIKSISINYRKSFEPLL